MAKAVKVRTSLGQWEDIAIQVPDMNNYAYLSTTPISGFRNAIINGDFRIWQRGASFSAAGYTADRWIIIADGSGATRSISQQTFTPGNVIANYEPSLFLRYNQSAAGSGATFNIIEQRIEDVRAFAGQQVTVSFWAKADTSRNVTSQVQQNFGSGGSAEVQAVSTQTISLTSSWQRFSYTFTMPSISGKTIGTNSYVAFRINVPNNATFIVDLWGVQMEAGSVATPFERRFIGTELDLCRRYFQLLGGARGVATSSTDVLLTLPLNPPMRVSPVVLATGPLNAQADGFGTSSTQSSFTKGFELNNPDSLYVTITGFSGLSQGRTYSSATPQNNANYLTLNAEL